MLQGNCVVVVLQRDKLMVGNASAKGGGAVPVDDHGDAYGRRLFAGAIRPRTVLTAEARRLQTPAGIHEPYLESYYARCLRSGYAFGGVAHLAINLVPPPSKLLTP